MEVRAMPSLEAITQRVEAAIPGARLAIVANESAAAQPSVIVPAEHAPAVAEFLRDAPELRFDYVSNVTGVDWLDRVVKEKKSVAKTVDGEERSVEETVERTTPGYLEAVYHLYSMERRHGPLVLRVRTVNRTDDTQIPSLTPVWRGAEFQEREIFDLYGIAFTGHPDLRRLLMWEEFEDHPMRKDYVEPDDYEYEPTAHDAVLKKARAHESMEGAS